MKKWMLLLLLPFLISCGQKGPLYLPEAETQETTSDDAGN